MTLCGTVLMLFSYIIKSLYTWRKAERIANNSTTIKGLLPGETVEQDFKRLEREANKLRQANEVLREALGLTPPPKKKSKNGFLGPRRRLV